MVVDMYSKIKSYIYMQGARSSSASSKLIHARHSYGMIRYVAFYVLWVPIAVCTRTVLLKTTSSIHARYLLRHLCCRPATLLARL